MYAVSVPHVTCKVNSCTDGTRCYHNASDFQREPLSHRATNHVELRVSVTTGCVTSTSVVRRTVQ